MSVYRNDDWWGVYYASGGDPLAVFVLEEDARDWVASNPGFAKVVLAVTVALEAVRDDR